MTTRAPTFAPPNALLLWTDGRTIFAELPGNPATYLSFPCHDAGLSKALALLKTHADYSGTPTLQTKLKSASASLAESLLRRHGIIK